MKPQHQSIGNIIGKVCQLLALKGKVVTKHQVGEVLGVGHRQAHKYLKAMEASGMAVAIQRGHFPEWNEPTKWEIVGC